MFDSMSRRASGFSMQFLRRDMFLLLGILVLAAFLRLWNLGTIGFRGDEAVYAGQAAVLAGEEQLSRYFVLVSRGNSNFLLYQYTLSFFYRLFGVSDVLGRAVAAGYSTLTVLVVFELGRTLYGRNVGLVAALLLAISSYSVSLGRLAFLDPALVFFFSLTLLCGAKWVEGRGERWLFAASAAAALLIQAKVTGVLALATFGLYLLASGSYRRLRVRTVLLCVPVGLAFLTPVLIQFGGDGKMFLALLSDSSRRVSSVPWYYYIAKMVSYEGLVIPLIWLAGVGIALARRTRGDLLCLLWVLVVAAFFQLYPLKAFNYLLPIVPAMSLLGARAVVLGAGAAATALGRAPERLRRMAPALVPALLVLAAAPSLTAVLHDDKYVGMREAGYWLKQNAPADAGILTPSNGSAQFALSFYARRDAYPFGRFRLATVLPGGELVKPRPRSDGGLPTDWISYWPQRKIQDKTVSYLVYYTHEGDDPPENPIVRTDTQRRFRALIEEYDGRLAHTVFYNHEGRVWIYEVGKRLPLPRVAVAPQGDRIQVEGDGFRIDSDVTVYYHSKPIARYRTDEDGSFSGTIRPPRRMRPAYFLHVEDEAGNYDSLKDLKGSLEGGNLKG